MPTYRVFEVDSKPIKFRDERGQIVMGISGALTPTGPKILATDAEGALAEAHNMGFKTPIIGEVS